MYLHYFFKKYGVFVSETDKDSENAKIYENNKKGQKSSS